VELSSKGSAGKCSNSLVAVVSRYNADESLGCRNNDIWATVNSQTGACLPSRDGKNQKRKYDITVVPYQYCVV